MLPVKSNAADNKGADDSPFGVMLAATAALQTKTQTPKPASGDDNPSAVKSDSASKDAPVAPKDHRDTAAAQTSPAKTTDSKSATKSTDAADAKAPAKDGNAANDKDSTQQTAQAQPAQDQPPVQQPQVQPPLPQPDPGALAMAQAQTGAAQPVPGAAANDDTDAGTDDAANVGAVGADSAKTAAAAAPPAGPGTPDMAAQAAAEDAAPQNPATPGNVNLNGKSFAASLQAKVSDGKAAPAPGDDAKITAQADNAAPQPQTPAPQAQAAAQTPPPAAPTANGAAVPALNLAAPVQNSAAVAVSSTVQVAAHAGDTAATMNTLAVAIAAKTQSGARQFDIRLDPPELGRVEVRLSIDASGKTEAHMTADQQDTLNLLQKDSGSLTQALRDAGLDVSHSGLNFSLRGQSGQNGGDNSQGQGARANLTASRAIDAAQGATSAISFTGGGAAGRLDIHV